MKNYTQKIIVIFFLFVVAYSCSTKKDTVINRNFHALTTKYNVLFNGQETFNKGIEEINTGYKDDWFSRLPIEPIVFEEDKIVMASFNSGPGAGFGGQTNEEKNEVTIFERAEEKAVKAIQKHGMNIDGTEHNRQIDNAYLLLGKSRYFSQRFIPAIDAFNYVIQNYPQADLIAETKIWRAKANTRNDNEETAIEAMKLLLFVKDSLEANLPDKIKEQAHTALAMAYVKSDSLQKAKKHLQLATRTLKDKEQGARNLFILGQMFSDENKKDSAFYVFNKLANFKKAPHKYKIHAHIELAKNNPKDSLSSHLIVRLQKLINDRENRPFLDELYYQKAVLHQKKDSIKLAVADYNNSLRAKNGGDKQKTFTYEKLGDLYFKDSEYQYASAYYDSVLQVSKDSLDIRIRRIKRKHKNLASLIKFEEIVTTNDSIVKIATMSKEDQKLYFESYIEKLKKSDQEAAQLRLNQMAFGNSGANLQTGKKGAWYFYNNQSLSFGKTEFKKVWGNRRLEDNWRWSEKAGKGEIATKEQAEVNIVNLRYDIETYVSTVPTKTETIDSLKADRNQALYELGLIYKEQFKNQNLAKQRLERLASLEPAEALALPINWHLYQIYTTLGDAEKADTHKNVILSKYPETKFAQIILNPNKKTSEEAAINDVENEYKKMYYLYKQGKFEETVLKIDAFIATIPNANLIPKFELLKAYAIGKHKDKEAYKKALDFVAVSYGNTEEGKKAKEILTLIEK